MRLRRLVTFTDSGPVETLLRIILLRWSGRGLSPAWFVVFAFALCGTLTYAVEHEGYSSATSELQQAAEKHAAASQDRRISVQSPTDKHAKHGPVGSPETVSLNPASLTHRSRQKFDADTVTRFVFNRRYTSSAAPRAPPC